MISSHVRSGQIKIQPGFSSLGTNFPKHDFPVRCEKTRMGAASLCIDPRRSYQVEICGKHGLVFISSRLGLESHQTDAVRWYLGREMLVVRADILLSP